MTTMLWNGTRSEQQNEMQVRHRHLAFGCWSHGQRGSLCPVWSSRSITSKYLCWTQSLSYISRLLCPDGYFGKSDHLLVPANIQTELVGTYHYYYDESICTSHSKGEEYGWIDSKLDIFNWPPVCISWGTKKWASGWILRNVSILCDKE